MDESNVLNSESEVDIDSKTEEISLSNKNIESALEDDSKNLQLEESDKVNTEVNTSEKSAAQKSQIVVKWKKEMLRLKTALDETKAQNSKLIQKEAKLTDFLRRAKLSIESYKKEIQEKDDNIFQLQEEVSKVKSSIESGVDSQEPRRLLNYCIYGYDHWCLVEYEDELSESNLDATAIYKWIKFSNENELREFASRNINGEPLRVPALSLSPTEAAKVMQDAKDEVCRIQEEFRRYRVRSEISRKQKEAEIQKATAKTIARHQEKVAEGDLEAELDAARSQIRRLSRLQTELDNQDIMWKEKFDKLRKENESLKSSAGETALAAEWRERYEQLLREKEELQQKFGLDTSEDNGAGRYDKLKKEYSLYRKRALEIIEEKERHISDLQRQIDIGSDQPNSDSSTGTRPSTMVSKTNVNSKTTNEYLKNIVLKYMSTEQPEVKEHMEAAIATVLHFSPKEIENVQNAKKQGSWSLW